MDDHHTAPRMTGALHFSIDAAWFTSHLHALVLEGRWDAARRTLTDGLIGISLEQAESVLAGRCTLVDTETGMAVEDAPPGTEDDLRSRHDALYSGYLADRSAGSGGQIWRLEISGTMQGLDLTVSADELETLEELTGRSHGAVEAAILTRSRTPEHARVSTAGMSGVEGWRWAVFVPATRPITAPWWPDPVATNEDDWWARRGVDDTTLTLQFDLGGDDA